MPILKMPSGRPPEAAMPVPVIKPVEPPPKPAERIPVKSKALKAGKKAPRTKGWLQHWQKGGDGVVAE